MTLTRGDSLSQIFERFELPRQDFQAITEIASYKRYSSQPAARGRSSGSKVGHVVIADSVTSIPQHLDGCGGDAFGWSPSPSVGLLSHLEVIRSSLFQAGKDAGLSQQAILQLGQIFAHEIDFALDLREGDELKVVYEASYRDGEEVLRLPVA